MLCMLLFPDVYVVRLLCLIYHFEKFCVNRNNKEILFGTVVINKPKNDSPKNRINSLLSLLLFLLLLLQIIFPSPYPQNKSYFLWGLGAVQWAVILKVQISTLLVRSLCRSSRGAEISLVSWYFESSQPQRITSGLKQTSVYLLFTLHTSHQNTNFL